MGTGETHPAILHRLLAFTCMPNKRIDSHKVFNNLATGSKTTMGWFFGLKLHVVVNDRGEMMASTVRTGKKCDHNLALLTHLTHRLQGNLAADKGYISKKAVEH